MAWRGQIKTVIFVACRRLPMAAEAVFYGDRMADDLTKRGPQDRSKVNVNERWEVDYWTRKWNVTEAQLRAAVEVGTSAAAVARHLGK
jgi:hypothetical protein